LNIPILDEPFLHANDKLAVQIAFKALIKEAVMRWLLLLLASLFVGGYFMARWYKVRRRICDIRPAHTEKLSSGFVAEASKYRLLDRMPIAENYIHLGQVSKAGCVNRWNTR
jgi:hypothetical protein